MSGIDGVIVSAEIGVNHQGSIGEAERLVDAAARVGANFVKFQKRDPELAVPREQWSEPKETPWGETMPYIEYRQAMEFDFNQYMKLQRRANHNDCQLFFSVWDMPSLEFAERFACPYVKIPSAKLTDVELVTAAAEAVGQRGAGLILSTGMSDADQIQESVQTALDILDAENEKQPHLDGSELWVLHCHSAYPAPVHELNLNCILALMLQWTGTRVRIGYSGHEYGRAPTEWAVALGAGMIERHITMDCTAVGSDHSASLEPWTFERLVAHIRSIEGALGDGVKKVWDSELPALRKLRGSTEETGKPL